MAAKKTPIAETFVSVVPETAQIPGAVERAFRSSDNDVRAAARRWRKDIEDELKRIDALKIDADTDPAERKLDELKARAKAKKIELPVDVDKDDLKRVASTISKALAGASAGAMGAQLVVGGAGAVTALTGALLPAVGALALIPAVATAAGLAMGTLKLATAGFSDALKAQGDPKQFAEALGKLAPNAQQAALAIHEMDPAIKDFKAGIQDNFMDGFSGQVQALGGTYLPILKSAMGDMATSANVALRQIGDLLQAPERVADVSTLTGNASTAFGSLSQALRPVVGAFLDVATVGSTFLPALADGARQAGEAFGAMVGKARDSGQITEVIQTGIDVLKDFGSVLGNVGGILSGVFKAGQDVGGGLLNTLKTVTGGISDLVNSVAGQTALGDFFTSARDALGQVMPILKTVGVSVVGTILPAFLNLGTAIGPALQGAFTNLAGIMTTLAPVLVSLGAPINALLAGLGPALLDSVNALAPAIAPVATAFVDIVNATVPLIPVLADVAAGFGTGLASAVSAAADVIQPIATFFRDNETAGGLLKIMLFNLVGAFVAFKTAATISAAVTAVTSGLSLITGAATTATGAMAALNTTAASAGGAMAAAGASAAKWLPVIGTAIAAYEFGKTNPVVNPGPGQDLNRVPMGGEIKFDKNGDLIIPDVPTGSLSPGTLSRLHEGYTPPTPGKHWFDAPAPSAWTGAPVVVSPPVNTNYVVPVAPPSGGGGGGAGLPPGIANESRLKPDTIDVNRAISEMFPEIKKIGGYRPPDGYNEHSSGQALDIMIPDASTAEGRDLGDRVAAYVLDNADKFGVDYVLWQQAQLNANGTVKPMEDRGSPTANHRDHVHVHTRGGTAPANGIYTAPGRSDSANGMSTAYDTGTGGSTDKQLREAAEKVDDTEAAVRSKQMALDEINQKGTATAKQRADAETALAKAIREHADAVDDLKAAQNKPAKGDKGSGGAGPLGDLAGILGGGFAEFLGIDGSVFKSPGDLGIVKLFESFMKVGVSDGSSGGSGGGSGPLGGLGGLLSFATPGASDNVVARAGVPKATGATNGSFSGNVGDTYIDRSTNITGNNMGATVPEVAANITGSQLQANRPQLNGPTAPKGHN